MSIYLDAGENFATTSGLLVVDGGAVTTYSTTATINFSIRGVLYQKTAVTNGATGTNDINTGIAAVKLVGGNSVANTPGQGCAFLWMVNSAGTVKWAQGPVVALDMQDKFITAPQFPPVPAAYTVFAYQIITIGALGGLSWIMGTNNWNATGVVSSIKNVLALPDRPQVA